jgi:hypothetical protein
LTGLDVAVELGKSEGRAPTWGIHAFLYRDGKVHESWQPIARRERKPEGWTLVTPPEVAAERVEDDLRNWLHTAR